jgi:phage-related protein
MIVFNGVSIDSVAPVRIEDIHVSPIAYNPISRPRAIRFGSEFVRMGGGVRTVTISFAILDSKIITRHEAFMNLSKWARTDAEYKLEVPTDPTRYLECVCTSKPDPSTRAWWENKLKLVFTCFSNPYWTSKQERSAACGTQFNALGDAPPLMRIERTLSASASNQSYSNGTQTMTFLTIPAGNMVIDLNNQTAMVGTANIMQYYQPTGKFIIPATGVQTITGTGTVKFRERFE